MATNLLLSLAVLFKLSIAAPPISLVVTGGNQFAPAKVEIMVLIPGHPDNLEWRLVVKSADGGGWSTTRPHVGEFAHVATNVPYPYVQAGYYTANASLKRVVFDKQGKVTGTKLLHAQSKQFVIYTNGGTQP